MKSSATTMTLQVVLDLSSSLSAICVFFKHWEITKTIGFNMMTWMIRGYPPFGKPPFSHSPLIIDISCQNIHSISWLEATTTLKMEWGMTLRTLQALHLGLSSIETDLSNFKKRSLA